MKRLPRRARALPDACARCVAARPRPARARRHGGRGGGGARGGGGGRVAACGGPARRRVGGRGIAAAPRPNARPRARCAPSATPSTTRRRRAAVQARGQARSSIRGLRTAPAGASRREGRDAVRGASHHDDRASATTPRVDGARARSDFCAPVRRPTEARTILIGRRARAPPRPHAAARSGADAPAGRRCSRARRGSRRQRMLRRRPSPRLAFLDAFDDDARRSADGAVAGATPMRTAQSRRSWARGAASRAVRAREQARDSSPRSSFARYVEAPRANIAGDASTCGACRAPSLRVSRDWDDDDARAGDDAPEASAAARCRRRARPALPCFWMPPLTARRGQARARATARPRAAARHRVRRTARACPPWRARRRRRCAAYQRSRLGEHAVARARARAREARRRLRARGEGDAATRGAASRFDCAHAAQAAASAGAALSRATAADGAPAALAQPDTAAQRRSARPTDAPRCAAAARCACRSCSLPRSGCTRPSRRGAAWQTARPQRPVGRRGGAV